ncbi:hypothetical protein FYK55_28245 [Roseiconus nitratireducens]|uniref:Uncharacterized protein n=1 Tax=Roseiconus nitratireducens TaxID=2605748 RepID=A0A5M6CLJ3_9BACT|nr:hypothetical protein [Roseiconus nitratireducens]KAA5536088.1 hypothetical protein FYK55_28245 [Roseiconus nitratireducens]
MTDDSHVTLITKRNWDRLLLPVVGVSLVFAALFGTLTGFWRAFTLPGFTLTIWLFLRCTTPARGTKAVTINGNPKVKALLKWLSFFMLLTAGWMFVDTIVIGNSIHAPLSMAQIFVFVLLVGLLLAGVFVIERRYPTKPKPPSSGG